MFNKKLDDIKKIALYILLCLGCQNTFGQLFPTKGENIDFISTFGNESEKQWGDDDFIQVIFFIIPKQYQSPVFIKVFDPGTEGQHDLQTLPPWNTKTNYSVYGGIGAFTNPDARNHTPTGNFRSGNQLISLTFGAQPNLDNQWYTLGSFNPKEGEYFPAYNGYIFKVIIEGVSGDDGNLYRFFLSQSAEDNIPIPGSNAFTYKFSFRLKNEGANTAHLYPLIDKNVKSIIQYNFDFDNEGSIKLYSVAKHGHKMAISGDDETAKSTHSIVEKEHGKSMDIQIIKNADRINDMTFYLLNQYEKAIPFFAIPIGGIPKYSFKVNIENNYKNNKRSY